MTFKYFNNRYLLFLYFYIKKILPSIGFVCCFFYFVKFFTEIGSVQNVKFLKIKHKASPRFNIFRFWLVSKHIQQPYHKKINNNSAFFLYPAKRFYGQN